MQKYFSTETNCSSTPATTSTESFGYLVPKKWYTSFASVSNSNIIVPFFSISHDVLGKTQDYCSFFIDSAEGGISPILKPTSQEQLRCRSG